MKQLPRRPRLESRLDGALAHRLTVLVADAGFGKTTLLASWSAGLPAVVYRFTRADRDLTRLWRRLVGTLRRHLPDLLAAEVGGSVAVPGPLSAHGDSVRAQAMAELLGQSLAQHLTRDLVLVLDDAHLVSEGPAARLLAGLVRHAPPLLHVVLSSRGPLPVPATRLRAQGEVLEVTGAELAFTTDEVVALLTEVLGPEGPGPEAGGTGLAEEVRAATGGWPIAVRLAVEGLRGVEPADRAGRVARMVVPHGQLTELIRTTYAREPAPVRRLVAIGALFDRFTGELCGALGVPDAAGVLAGLVRRGLFVERAHGDDQGAPEPEPGGQVWYRLHPLTRRFVAARAALPAAETTRLHQVAADWFADHGLRHAALRSLVTVADHDRVTRLLAQAGEQLVASGHAEVVVDAVRSLPADRRDAGLEQLAGHAYLLRGDWDEALARYTRAAGDRGTLPAGLAWRTGMVHYLRGEHDRALGALQRAQPDPGRDGALVLAWTAAVHWVRGDPKTCGEAAAAALGAATTAGDAAALAAAHTVLSMLAAWEGDRRANAAHYERALAYAQQAGDVLQLIRIRVNRASHSIEEGDYPAGMDELEVAVRLADLYGYGAFGGLALTNRAELRLRLGRLEEAQRDLTAALAIFDDLGSRIVAYPLRLLGYLRHLRGDRAGAGRAYEQALAHVAHSGDLQATVPALAGLARLRAEEEQPPEPGATGNEENGDGEAGGSAESLVAQALGHGEGLGHVAALLAAARVALARGDRAGATRRAQQAREQAQARRDRPGVAESWEIEATATRDDTRARELAGRSAALWDEIGDPVGRAGAELAYADRLDHAAARAAAAAVRRQMDEIGCRWMSARAEAVASRHATPDPDRDREQVPEPDRDRDPDREAVAPVRVQTLGTFRLVRDGVVVPVSVWKSRKARDVLKILVARRGRPVTRELLMETLWPDESPAAAAAVANRLHVAVSTLRTVLDPEHRFPVDTFVATEDDVVWVRLDQVEVDVETFLDDATNGAAALRAGHRDRALPRLARAESGYAGDFLEEDLYADWAVPLREQARAAYLEVAATLAEQARTSGDPEAAIRYLLRILEYDPYDEHAHLRLVSTCAEVGRHGDARRHYRHYCARMEELDVEAAPYPTRRVQPVPERHL